MIGIERKEIKSVGKIYKEYIVTDLEDVDFISEVLVGWARYELTEAEAILADAVDNDMLIEGILLSEGFDILENTCFIPGDSITLIKVGNGMWVVEGFDESDLEDFVLDLE